MNKFLLNFPLSIILLLIVSSCQLSPEKNKTAIQEELSPGVDGIQKKYRADKTLLSAIEHKDGKRHGVSRSYYEDGKIIHNEIRYNMGSKNGMTNSYYKNGQLYYTVEYLNGKREGILMKFYETSELMAEVPYKNGAVQPGLIEYQKSGNKKKIYPHIVFEEINKIKTENKFLIRIKLSKNNKSVKFTQILFDEFGEELVEKILISNDGIAEIIYYVRKNTFKVVNLKIRAELKTYLGNTYVTYKEKEIKISF